MGSHRTDRELLFRPVMASIKAKVSPIRKNGDMSDGSAPMADHE